MSIPRPLLSLTAGLTLVTLAVAADEPTLAQRLEKLAGALEAARVEAHVPGLSIAVVADDEVVWARGFGLADVAAGTPADEHTIYGVGSTTKAFTATLVGMLVDEGRVAWDDPVSAHLPWFDLPVRSDDEDAACTLRDLLCHRHGFARMGLLWFNSRASREEILRTALGAEPWDDFRAGFHYCNVTYLAAGEAAGAAAGQGWDALMEERLFGPLGMTSSSLAASGIAPDAPLALGYEWDEVARDVARMARIDLHNVGPAGALNSSVVDMAQWLRLQLGRGEIDGERLISRQALLETWEPQITIGDQVSYGLGWMLHEHDGRRVVEHGGNIDGFSAQVTLVPEEGLGYVLLMNLDASPLQLASIPLVLDALLDEWPDQAPAAPAPAPATEVELEQLAGIYIASFATFRDERFEVLVQDDRLALDVPSQQTFALEPPDAQGRWRFSLTDQIAVSFQRDERGAVTGLTMHQGGASFDVPREGVELEPEVPREQLERYTGTFVRAQGGKRVEIRIVQGRLAMEDKGRLLPFETPDAEGRAALRPMPELGATFEVDPDGSVDSFVFHGDAGDRLFTRVADGAGEDLPSLDELLALRRTDARVAALAAAGGTRVTGEVWVAQSGLRGRLRALSQGADRHASHLDFGRFGRIDLVVREGRAWSYTSMRGFEELKGLELTQALLEAPGAVEGDWREHFDAIEVVRMDPVGERPAVVVRLRKGDLPSRSYWVDLENGDVLRAAFPQVGGLIRIPMTVTYSDFVQRDGIRRPGRVELANPHSGRTVLTFEEVETGLELGDEAFTLVDPDDREGARR